MSIDRNKLKTINTALRISYEHRDRLRTNIKDEQRRLTICNTEIKAREKEKTKLVNDKGIIVSEHAILRYLERVGKLDIESVQKQILTKEVENQIGILNGNGKISIDGYTIVIKNSVITTITN